MKENKVIITFKLNNWLLVLNYYSMALFSEYKKQILPRYCKNQRNAAVIILRYTMLRHNGL